MDKQAIGPSGYPSNTAAIYHLIRHGFAIWGLHRMAVLLFHVERSTAYGKESDQHSQGQAMEGIYSHTAARRDGGRGRWIRGRAGVSRAQLKRENRELLKAGLIRKIRRKGKNDADAATEYIPDWLAIRAALEEHEYAAAPGPQPLLSQTFSAPPVALPEPPPRLSQSQAQAPPEPPPWLPQSPTVVDVPLMESTVSESRTPEGAAGATAPTHSLFPVEEESKPNPAGDVAAVIEGAYGRPLWANDPIPGQVLAIAERIGVPLQPLCIFLQEAAATWRSKGYPVTSPKLFLKATAEDLIPWARANASMIYSAQLQESRDRYRAAAPAIELPAVAAQPEFLLCPQCNQEAIINGTCHSSECVEQRQQQPATRRASGDA